MKYMKLFAIMVTALMAVSLAAQNCSLATVKGNFGSHAEGTILVSPTPLAPTPPYFAAAVGLHNFDGQGNWTLTYAISLGGFIVPWGSSVTGTYEVTPDCKITVTGTSMPTKFVGTITGDGMTQKMYITYVDPPRVQSGVLSRTPVAGCSDKTIKGKYALAGQGFVVPGGTPVPVAHVGDMTIDGKGTFFGQAIYKTPAGPGTNSFTATYEVNSNCTLSAVISNSDGSTTHEFGVITGQGNFQEIHLIITDTGWIMPDTIVVK